MDEQRRPFDAAADRRIRSLTRHRTPASVLLDTWRASTTIPADDWWVPAVDAVARAVVQRRDARGACTGLGWARAQQHLGIRVTLEDLFALYHFVRAAGPPASAARSVVRAWAEESLAPVGFSICGHPRYGATEHHLRTLLGGLFELGGDDGPPVSEEFQVLLVDAPDEQDENAGWEPVIRLLELGAPLRDLLPAHALLVVLTPGRLGTLVRRDADLPRIAADNGFRTAEVPADLDSAYRLLEQVTY